MEEHAERGSEVLKCPGVAPFLRCFQLVFRRIVAEFLNTYWLGVQKVGLNREFHFLFVQSSLFAVYAGYCGWVQYELTRFSIGFIEV